MIKCYKKMLILLVCIISSLSVQAQGYSKYDYLSMAMARFENGEYQEARSYIKKYASFELNDKEKELATDLSSKCKSCEDFINKANTEYIEGKLANAEAYYLKLKELNPKHPNIQQLIANCHKVTTESAKRVTLVTPPNKTSKRSFSFNSIFQDYELLAWNIIGVGYPWNLTTGFEYRYGKNIGFGLYCDVGLDLSIIEATKADIIDYTWDPVSKKSSPIYGDGEHSTVGKCTFRYDAGVRIYPYKGLFLDFGYGTIARTNAEVKNLNYQDYHDNSKIRKMVSNGYGWLFHIGYNLMPNFYYSSDFYFGFCGGFSYDVVNKEYAPSINLKIGVAWKL